METRFVRRYRMEINLSAARLPLATLPLGYEWTRWDADHVERHAHTKYLSFRSEIDARVFPCLGQLDGCDRLMAEIASQETFLPQATWLISCRDDRGLWRDCGTIQGLSRTSALGAVQNIGVVPEHRGRGLGRALLLQSLRGFRDAGLNRVYLEVTSSNHPAVELYRSLGFRLVRTMYKALEAEIVTTA